MRALGLIPWVCLIAACHPNGLTLEVEISGSSIAKVELYVADRCYPDCPRGTVPPGLPAMALDGAFTVHDSQPFTIEKADFEGGVAGFRIEATEEKYIAILAAVAYDGQGQIRWSWSKNDVTVGPDDTRRWRIQLEPSTPIEGLNTAPPPAGTQRHKDWPDPNGHPSCLLLEYWTDEGTPYRELLAPETDTDCDGVSAETECAPWIPNASAGTPRVEQANCVAVDTVNAAGTVCVLGGPECNETNPNTGCEPLVTPYCVPTALCACAGPDREDCVRAAMVTGTNQVGVMPFLKCTIPVSANGDRCDSGKVVIDARSLVQGTSSVCKSLLLNEAETPLGAFHDYLHVGTGKILLSNFEEPCKVEVNWQAGMAAADTYALLDAELDNGYHLAIPARVEVRTGCTGSPKTECIISSLSSMSEQMFNCAEAASVPSCEPDHTGACDGPLCGTECCTRGESCTPDGCSCGGGPACGEGDTCQFGNFNETGCGAICCGATPCPV